MTDTPPPLAVDYSGLPLHEGDTVAYLSHDPIGLTQGRIRVITEESICLETGRYLVSFTGVPASYGTSRPRPVTGTVRRDEDVQEPFRYPQVALQHSQDGDTVMGHVDPQQIGDAVRADTARHLDHIRRAQQGSI